MNTPGTVLDDLQEHRGHDAYPAENYTYMTHLFAAYNRSHQIRETRYGMCLDSLLEPWRCTLVSFRN